MRRKIISDYIPGNIGPLKIMLSDIFTGLGNLADKFCLVGGLVPAFLVTNKLEYLKEYLGTLDIDLAVEIAVEQSSEFKDLYGRLRTLGFEKQKTEDGFDLMAHSYIKRLSGQSFVILDLIIDDRFEPKADKLKEISPTVEAAKFRGVYLVFHDCLIKEISQKSGKPVRVKIPNVIPFLALKSFAYADTDNGTAKDAFDIWYTVVNYESGPDSVKKELVKYKDNSDVRDAFTAIKGFFKTESSKGTRDVARILTTRYGLSMSLANREILTPFLKLSEL